METETPRHMKYPETQGSFKVRQELRPSTIEISTANVRLTSPAVSMNGLVGGMVVKQPTFREKKEMHAGLSNVPNPVLAKPRD